MPPAADTLCVDQIVVDRLHSPIPDIVHPMHPEHLILGLELFCDTFHLSHLLYQPKEHFLCLPVDVSKATVQLATGEQGGIGCPAMLLQIAPVALSPHADGLLLFFGQFQIGEIIIPNLCVSAAHLFKNCLCYFVLPSKFVYLQYEFSHL